MKLILETMKLGVNSSIGAEKSFPLFMRRFFRPAVSTWEFITGGFWKAIFHSEMSRDVKYLVTWPVPFSQVPKIIFLTRPRESLLVASWVWQSWFIIVSSVKSWELESHSAKIIIRTMNLARLNLLFAPCGFINKWNGVQSVSRSNFSASASSHQPTSAASSSRSSSLLHFYT